MGPAADQERDENILFRILRIGSAICHESRFQVGEQKAAFPCGIKLKMTESAAAALKQTMDSFHDAVAYIADFFLLIGTLSNLYKEIIIK